MIPVLSVEELSNLEDKTLIVPCFRFKNTTPFRAVDFWDSFDKDINGLFDFLKQQRITNIKDIPNHFKKQLKSLKVSIDSEKYETVEFFFQPLINWSIEPLH